MKYDKIAGTENLYVAIDPTDVHCDFDREMISAIAFFYRGIPDGGGIIEHETHLRLSQTYIDDLLGLSDNISEKEREAASVDALISAAQKAYIDKKGIPKSYNMIIATKYNAPFRYSVLPKYQDS